VPERVELVVDGHAVALDAEGTLLEALREQLGILSPKDGCAPQGQCGCCTVLVDGAPRVACVTPVRRLAGRSVTTLEGLDPALLDRLVGAVEATGASQCGFCTPGILMRLAGSGRTGGPSEERIANALSAHLCRCTGVQPLVEAALLALDPEAELPAPRDPAAAQARATLESGVAQRAGRDVVLGRAGFAADRLEGAVVALATEDGGYALGPTPSAARRAATKVQGRNSTRAISWPLEPPDLEGAVLQLATTFVEPAYLEPDASRCSPGGEAGPAQANAGAFGAKRRSAVVEDARRLADEHGGDVVAVWPREEVVRRGKKRPPLALALRADGTGALRVATTPGSDDVASFLASLGPALRGLEVEVVEVPGPPIGTSHRGAVLAEVLAARAALEVDDEGWARVGWPDGGARAAARVVPDGTVELAVAAGAPLCAVTLRSYAIGAAHQALGQVRSEALALDADGRVVDLTIRSFGILGPKATPRFVVAIDEDDDRDPVPAGPAVLAATLAAAWAAEGLVPRWPTRGA
jgi:xanthine dehydrogenase small subunit